jgi:hypothetical protein
MRALVLWVLFAVGAVAGFVLGVIAIFWVSLIRGARAVHADGVVCRAELIAHDALVGPRLAGAALVRLSGAFEPQDTTGKDVLGLDLRLRRPAQAGSLDATIGEQDLPLGTFESFITAARDRDRTDAVDYLDNRYSSVTPWWVPGVGPTVFHLLPPPPRPRDRGADRLARLDADLVDDQARLGVSVEMNGGMIDVAELRLIERLPIDGRALRVSMFRQGRAIRPVGFRNGVRATVYPISQLARRLRGG